MAIVLIGRSGSGKGVTDKLARIVWPASIHEEGLGSGQGIHELFKETKDPDDRVTRALFTVSEIDHMAALASGRENNTLAALKAGLTGDRLGSKGASAATTRSVPADSYRLGLSISAQYGHTAVLLDDVSGGTPQRMVWGSVTDPSIPDTPGPEPDRVLDTKLPTWALADKQVLIQYGTPDIAEYVAAGLLANQRGELDAIDGHRTLTRLKVAAALAIVDHRSVISDLDWQLSEVVMAKSDATRQSVLEYDRQAARAKVRERAAIRAAGEDFYDASRLETVKRSILRMLERDGEQQGNVLRSRLGRKEKRELFDQAIVLLEAAGLVTSMPGLQKGTRYRTGGQGDHDGQGAFAQVNHPDHVGQGDHSAMANDVDTARSDDSDHQADDEHRPPLPTPEDTMKLPRPTACARCYVALPAAATRALCDDCDGAPAPITKTKQRPERQMHVVHSGQIAKRDGGLGGSGYHLQAPNGHPPRQTPRETA
ncbi:hypothetical protein [[Mycobacterium] burgundiense]|uniref:ATP-binding protein n=1 Tax=[Mycobacterium] burgundiense TaxID=3064286 RepID=A0ABM9L9A2_9MYCO|nr:hypothetical protein [Mycolicibacterium sp. MU0053]CAJ1495114.1 hypothetical protein MU0053_000274 [Mycolicibacterium sp. MU0053]